MARGTLRLYIDGAARGNPGPAGIGAILQQGTGRPLKELAIYLGEATNNVAESCALILALQSALQLDASRVEVFTDSELLARQVNGEYRVRDSHLQVLHALIRHLIQGFDSFQIRHIPREENRRADRLANRAVTEGLRKNPSAGRRKVPAAVAGPDQPTLF